MACLVLARGMPHFSGTVALSNARRVLRFGASRLGDAHALEDHAIDARRSDQAARIPNARMFDIWADLAKRLDAPDLPIAVAEATEIDELDLLGFVVLAAPTLRESLETFVRYSALLNDGRRWQLEADAKRLGVRLVESCPRTLGVRLSHETALAQLVRAVRRLSGGVDPLAVSFAHAAPSDLRAHRALFQCNVAFDAPSDSVVFARDLLDDTTSAGNRALWTYLCAHADTALAQLTPRPLADRVRDEVARALAEGLVPDMSACAATLGTTERTLRRALANDDITFRQLVDEARRDRTRELLSARPDSITRVAFEAGFSDTSAFTHACRRWFGRPPRDLVRARRNDS